MNHSFETSLFALFVLIGCSSDATSPATSNAGASGAAAGGSGGSSTVGGGGANPGAAGSATSGGANAAGRGGSSAGAGGELATSGAAGSAVGGNGGAGASGGTAGSGGTTGCTSYPLCDDFETNVPGDAASSFKIIAKSFSMERVTDQAHSGTHSMHVKGTADSGYAYLQETKTFPSTDFWGRAFLRMQAPSGGHQVFIGLDTNSNESQGDQVRLLNNLGGGKVATNRRSDDKSKNSATAIPMGTWFCYEWHEAPTALSIYLDGKELTDVDEMWQEPTLVSLVIGMERFTPGTAGDVWIDDVAVANTRVGCN